MSSRALEHLSKSLASENFAGFSTMTTSAGIVTPSHLKNYIHKQQFERVSQDIGTWRDAIREAELAYHPSRVQLNRMFIDTVENPHIKTIYEAWMELTTQRDYSVYQFKDGKKVKSVDLSQALTSQGWFADYMEFLLDSMMHGYSLISLGDIVDDGFPNISSIQRENILPDGTSGNELPTLTSMVYGVDGIKFTDTSNELVSLANHWIPTKSPRATTTCGYGKLYNLALLEIHLRHVMGWNMDFLEGFGMPIKKGSTNKVGDSRLEFERFLASGASNQWILLDKGTNDDVTYEFMANAGTAWKGYDNVEDRLVSIATQMILGHPDAIKSSPGKLGGLQNSNKDGNNISLVQSALNRKTITAGNYAIRKINEVTAPKLRRLGKKVGSKKMQNYIPVGYCFDLLNDTEEDEIKRRENKHRQDVATWTEQFNKGGYNVDVKQLEEITGLKLTEAPPETKRFEERKTETEITRNEPETTDSATSS